MPCSMEASRFKWSDHIEPEPNYHERALEVIYTRFGYTYFDMVWGENKRKRPLVQIRQVYCWFMHRVCGVGCEIVGSNLSIDHSTVLHNCDVVEEAEENTHKLLYDIRTRFMEGVRFYSNK